MTDKRMQEWELWYATFDRHGAEFATSGQTAVMMALPCQPVWRVV